jgi:hypothetical protein
VNFHSISEFQNINLFFSENFFYDSDNLITDSYNFLFFLGEFTNFTLLDFFDDSNLYTKSLITFIDQTEDMSIFQNLENVSAIYHYSVPNVKLAYPEPFIASPSFIHSDL